MSNGALDLRDVKGPSALGGGTRRAAELLYLLASTEFKRTYFGTVLGYLWSLCRPLLLFAVLLEVFTHVVRLGAHVRNYPVLLLLNIVLFGFFQESTNAAVPSIVSQEAVVRKTQFPRLVIPLAVVTTALFNLAINLIVVFAFVVVYGIAPTWTWLLLPIVVGAFLVLAAAVSMLVSSLYPRFRDTAIIWAVLSTALFYATPVLYPLQRLHGTFRTLVAMNPLTLPLELARRWVIDPHAPIDTTTVPVAVPAAIAFAVIAVAIWVFNREAPRIAEEL